MLGNREDMKQNSTGNSIALKATENAKGKNINKTLKKNVRSKS